MKRFIKVLAILVTMPIVCILLVFGYAAAEDYYWKKQEALISLDVSYSFECHEKTPIKLSAKNESDYVVNKIEWDIGVFNKGYSTNLAEKGYLDYSYDKILQPGEAWGLCRRLPNISGAINVESFDEFDDMAKLHSKLSYVIKNKDVEFEK